MTQRAENLAILTARGGSKGLPRKNLALLGGLPLIAHSINAALASQCFAEVLVSTEDEEIAHVSLKYQARVVNRPKALASDEASSLDVIDHVLRDANVVGRFKRFMLLQPTSPLRSAEQIREAFSIWEKKKAKSLVSVTRVEHPPQKMLIETAQGVEPIVSWQALTTPRQQLAPAYRINGAIYLCEVSNFLASKNLFAPPLAILEMDARSSVDIDSAEDLQRAEALLR